MNENDERTKLHGGPRVFVDADFSASVSPLGIHPAAAEALHSAALHPGSCCPYPDPDCSALRALLAGRWGCDASDFVCGAGARRTMAGEGQKTLFFVVFQQIQGVDGDGACLTLHLDALTGQIVKADTVLFEGGGHGRHLHNVATEGGESRLDLRQGGEGGAGFGDLAPNVQRIADSAEAQGGGVALIVAGEMVQQFGAATDQ